MPLERGQVLERKRIRWAFSNNSLDFWSVIIGRASGSMWTTVTNALLIGSNAFR